MHVRRWNTVVEWLVVAIVAATHGGLVVAGPRLDASGPGYLAASVLPLCQVLLLVGWVLLGPGRAWIRWTALPALLLLGGIAWLWIYQPRPEPVIEAQLVQLMLTGAIGGGCLLVVRLLGFSIRPLEAQARDSRAQFSIAGLILLTTLVAAIVGSLEGLRPIIQNDVSQLSPRGRYLLDTVEDVVRPQTIRRLVVCAAIVGVASAGAWMVLRPGSPWIRLATVVVAIPVFATYLAHLAGDGELAQRAWSLTLALAMVAALTTYSVLPLRVFGYRLARRRAQPMAAKAMSVSQTSKPVTASTAAA